MFHQIYIFFSCYSCGTYTVFVGKYSRYILYTLGKSKNNNKTEVQSTYYTINSNDRRRSTKNSENMLIAPEKLNKQKKSESMYLILDTQFHTKNHLGLCTQQVGQVNVFRCFSKVSF